MFIPFLKIKNSRLKEVNLLKVTELVSEEPMTSKIWLARICCPLEKSRVMGADQTLKTTGVLLLEHLVERTGGSLRCRWSKTEAILGTAELMELNWEGELLHGS